MLAGAIVLKEHVVCDLNRYKSLTFECFCRILGQFGPVQSKQVLAGQGFLGM